MGYIGNKMSVRAYEAYESGEMPLSKWSKVAINVLFHVQDIYKLNYYLWMYSGLHKLHFLLGMMCICLYLLLEKVLY